MNDNQINKTMVDEIIDIPVPSEDLRPALLATEASIEVEEIQHPTGHFSVDYRRC